LGYVAGTEYRMVRKWIADWTERVALVRLYAPGIKGVFASARSASVLVLFLQYHRLDHHQWQPTPREGTLLRDTASKSGGQEKTQGRSSHDERHSRI
jgi:hypothetical protein